MILIYAGTWAQIDTGIWQVQKRYFHSLFCWIPFQTFFPRPKPGQFHIPGGFPMLGGYSLGLLLLLNLLAAHIVRFKLAWKRTGIILIHLGLILLLVGEGITSAFQVESQMMIDVGQTATYSQDIRQVELAILDTSPADHDNVAAIPASMLKTGATIAQVGLPVTVKIDEYFPNSQLLGPMQARSMKDAPAPRATAGDGVGISLLNIPTTSGTESAVDLPSAYVTLSAGSETIGTYLVSTLVNQFREPLFLPQDFQINGKPYTIQLRFKRLYKPYRMELLDFRFDRYPGTDIPKDFSSYVRLIDPSHNVDREIRIWMNNPLRYNGETFFQADWNKKTERGTVLQVVRNPGWTLPYIACIVGAIGLFTHFAIVLMTFLRKQTIRREQFASLTAPTGPRQPWFGSASILFPLALTALCALYVLAHARAPAQKTPYDRDAFGTLPVSYEGRIQPLDSLARNSMKGLLGRESFYIDNQRTPAIQFLLDLWSDRAAAENYEVFRIDNPELLNFLELKPKPKTAFQQITGFGGASPYRFSWNELKPKFAKLQPEFKKLDPSDEKNYSLFERRLTELSHKLNLFISIADIRDFKMVPPTPSTAAGQDWKSLAVAAGNAQNFESLPPTVQGLVTVLEDYNAKRYPDFNRSLASQTASYDTQAPRALAAVRFEHFFNRFDPFTNALVLYILAFILIALSWVGWSGPFRGAALSILALALAVHTFGLIARIYISGRPPVTNLTSSAIFIAWGAVLLSIGLEYVYRNGIGCATASLLGFFSLLIADRLALSGDTLKVLQAVLDTNFWLATHVVMITMGYAATFLAGFLGIIYVLYSLFFNPPAETETQPLSRRQAIGAVAITAATAAAALVIGHGVIVHTHRSRRISLKDLSRMIYGITCFAILFSFIGTVLGGIWADQSWGRFWGWDPKENGAVLIVLCNALLLHARWGGLVKDLGIACLAILGNIVTAWSWFGVNMLGVGLHSYGFMESALVVLLAFVLSQVALIVIASIFRPKPI
jgi:ABC-type transport system involved in cytochrome c biogenesis permease subunit